MTGRGGGRPAGVRPTLVVVPGLGLDARSWTPTLRHLHRAGGFSLAEVCLLPGSGLRGDRRTDLSPAALAERVLAVLPAGPVVLAGHSSGCQVVAHAVRAASGPVAGVVLVAPTTDPRASRWDQLGRRWWRTAVHEDPRQLPALVRQYAATGPVTMARAAGAARRDRIDRVLAEVTCEVLVVRGPHDRLCPEEWARSLGRTETLPAGGHMVPWTHGGEVAERLVSLPR